MSEAIVDQLETVEVNHEQRKMCRSPFGTG